MSHRPPGKEFPGWNIRIWTWNCHLAGRRRHCPFPLTLSQSLEWDQLLGAWGRGCKYFQEQAAKNSKKRGDDKSSVQWPGHLQSSWEPSWELPRKDYPPHFIDNWAFFGGSGGDETPGINLILLNKNFLRCKSHNSKCTFVSYTCNSVVIYWSHGVVQVSPLTSKHFPHPRKKPHSH